MKEKDGMENEKADGAGSPEDGGGEERWREKEEGGRERKK